MGLIIIEVLLIIILFLLSTAFWNYEELPIMFAVFLILALVIEIFFIILKPVDYKNFKAEYEVIKEMTTESDDLRDINYTEKIIEINTEIRANRELKDSFMVGVFYNKDIAELELLSKDGE